MSEKSTTPDLVEALRRSSEAFDRRDWDGVFAIYAPDAAWDLSLLGMGVFEGREAMRGFFEDWRGAYEEWDQVIEEFRDLGNGVTFSVQHQRGRLLGSSGVAALRYGSVAIWRDGLIERVTNYHDIDEGRAAAERLAEERG